MLFLIVKAFAVNENFGEKPMKEAEYNYTKILPIDFICGYGLKSI